MSPFLTHILAGYGMMLTGVAVTIVAQLWYARRPADASAFIGPALPAILVSALHGFGIVNLCYALAGFQGAARYGLAALLLGVGLAVIFGSLSLPSFSQHRRSAPSNIIGGAGFGDATPAT